MLNILAILAGILTAAILVPLGNLLYFRFRRPLEKQPQPREAH